MLVIPEGGSKPRPRGTGLQGLREGYGLLPIHERHNPALVGECDLALSALGETPAPNVIHLPVIHWGRHRTASHRVTQPPVGAGGRLTHLLARPHGTRADMVAERIRLDGGSVWRAVELFGISYSHACRIRAGWRPGGVTALPIPYRTRGWVDGRRNGWSTRAV